MKHQSILNKLSLKKISQYFLLIALIVFVVALFIYNLSDSGQNIDADDEVWNQAMTMGDSNAPHKMIEYTDYFCSFCAELHKAMNEDFKKEFIDSGKLRFEARIVNLLSEVSVNTDKGNQAAFCAAEQNKYWQYSDQIIAKIDQDYFSKGIGVKNVANPQKIEKLDDQFFIDLAQETALNVEQFTTCIASDKYLEQIAANSQKALRLGVQGLPNIVVNNYQASGFGGGLEELKLLLKAGGVQ